MAMAEQQVNIAEIPRRQQKIEPATVIIEHVSGVVKWFNVKCGYGFLNRDDTKEDVFVHYTGIAKCNPRKILRSLGDGEKVEFAVVAGPRGHEAIEVTGPNGRYARGSPYSAERRHWERRGGPSPQGETPRRHGRASRRGPDNQSEGRGYSLPARPRRPRRHGRRQSLPAQPATSNSALNSAA